MSDVYLNNGASTLERRNDYNEPLSPLVELLNKGKINLSDIHYMADLIFDKLGRDKYDYEISLIGEHLTILKNSQLPYVLEIFKENDEWQVLARHFDPCYNMLYTALELGYKLPKDDFSQN